MTEHKPLRLELDVGNTRIKWRLCSQIGVVQQGCDLKLDISFDQASPDWLCKVSEVWVSSVHQNQNDWVESIFPNAQYAVSKGSQAGVYNSYSDPMKMGVDRWLAMLAAKAFNKTSSHIVIDAGTAITLDVIDSSGQHLGGYICPGLNMMKLALLGGTNKVVAGQDWVLGRDPGTSTQLCVDHGIQDMVVSWLESHIHKHPEAEVSISGGDGKMLSELLGLQKKYYPDLVLDGLNISFKNK